MTALTTAVALPRFRVRGLRGAAVSAASLVAGALVWQLIGNHTKQASFVSFTATVRALYHLARSGVLFDALWGIAEGAGGYDLIDPQLRELQDRLKDEITEGL